MKKSYLDPSTSAENAGGVHLSKKKFKQIRDDFMKVPFLKRSAYNKQYERINQYLAYGDTQPAIVISTNPLTISAYSDEMDAVLLLCFPNELVKQYDLKKGTRLVTSNVYRTGNRIVRDIIAGDGYMERYINFTPMVQLFLSDQEEYVRERTHLFEEERWQRLQLLTEEKMTQYPNIKKRDGFYYLWDF